MAAGHPGVRPVPAGMVGQRAVLRGMTAAPLPVAARARVWAAAAACLPGWDE